MLRFLWRLKWLKLRKCVIVYPHRNLSYGLILWLWSGRSEEITEPKGRSCCLVSAQLALMLLNPCTWNLHHHFTVYNFILIKLKEGFKKLTVKYLKSGHTALAKTSEGMENATGNDQTKCNYFYYVLPYILLVAYFGFFSPSRHSVVSLQYENQPAETWNLAATEIPLQWT